MTRRKPHNSLAKKRHYIADRVRALRQQRNWSQAELADQLGLSQNRLSEIERGDGSFSAEQLLLLLALFNVAIGEFNDERPQPDLELQNALARLGASHLHETHVIPSAQLTEVSDVIREVLVDGSPRLVTGAAPVLIRHARTLNLRRIQSELQRLGFDHRLPWLIDNTLQAFAQLSADTRRRFVTAVASLQLFSKLSRNEPTPLDVLDAAIRSEKTVDATQSKASEISRHWGIVTALQPQDFVEALRANLERD